MIERLVVTLRALASDPAAADDRTLRADCADAVRLELDCPQQALDELQRDALRRLDDVLEAPGSDRSLVCAHARAAAAALGLVS